MNTTSITLLDRLTRGSDSDAWGRFVDLYTPLLLAWCRRLGMSDADSADLLQSVFVTLYQKLPDFRYDRGGSFRAWLRTVMLNTWRNQVRRRRLEGRQQEGSIDPEKIPDTDPRIRLDEDEYRSYLVRRALTLMQQQFEVTTWQACWEFVVNDRPAADVAEELGISVNSVYLAKSRVLRCLRAELQQFFDPS
ncbi:MAG: sigma-70 family RNA polymerase sigma factor [Planctomycetaceae bacterium]|nr:sigma-70 family RNA polymerase sigma factor [Planctomycetaceae bacterium]